MLTYKNRGKSTNFLAKRRQFTLFFCNYFTPDGIIWDYMPILAALFTAFLMRKTSFFSCTLLAFILMAACTGNKSQPAEEAGQASDSAVSSTEKDSTIYGTSDEFGMSTFTLITDGGDTLYLTRDDEDGTMARINGDLNEGDRYAITTREDGEALATAINLTQLDKILKNYVVINGHLVLTENGEKDTVDIVQMDEKGVTVSRKDGETTLIPPSAK